jgi:DNA polymerase-3 subunit epsilon
MKNPFIEEITHISQQDIENAPVFAEIVPDLLQILDGCIFVAHNVRFDYGFIRNELRRLSISFSSKQLCTVKLSRHLFPQHPSHNLDAIIERFNISCLNRHRAMGDTQVLLEFMSHCRNLFGEEKLYDVVKQLVKQPSLPPNADHTMINSLPDTPGVYIFYGENKMPLYVGKSKNIRERVLSHFNDDMNSVKEMNIALQLKEVDYIETAGELGALLKESQTIKEMSLF